MTDKKDDKITWAIGGGVLVGMVHADDPPQLLQCIAGIVVGADFPDNPTGLFVGDGGDIRFAG